MATAVGMKPVLIRLVQNPDKNPHYQKLLSDMRSTTFNGFITQPLTVGSYAHKYGEYGGYIGDIGLITGRTKLLFIFYAKNSADAVDLSHQIGQLLS